MVTTSTCDSYAPFFSRQPQDYKGYRKRLMLYHHKMKISKRASESVLGWAKVADPHLLKGLDVGVGGLFV